MLYLYFILILFEGDVFLCSPGWPLSLYHYDLGFFARIRGRSYCVLFISMSERKEILVATWKSQYWRCYLETGGPWIAKQIRNGMHLNIPSIGPVGGKLWSC